MVNQSRHPSILITRPAAQSARFALELRRAMGDLHIVQSPLLAPDYLTPKLPAKNFTALIVTSETGAQTLRRISALGHRLPKVAFCVGDRTAGIVREFGLDAISADGNAEALIALIKARQVGGPLLHIRGADSRGEIAETLTNGGIETLSAITYRQKPQDLSPAARHLLREKGPVIAPLFSPRTAELLVQQLPELPNAPIWVVGISEAITPAVAPLTPQRLEIAQRPTAAHMLATIQKMFGHGSTP